MSQIQSAYLKYPLFRKLLTPAVKVRQMLGINRASRDALRDTHQNVIFHHLEELAAEDPVLRLREFTGTFQMSASSHLFARIVRDGAYEPEIARLVDLYLPKDRDVLDVGANIGFFSVKFAKQTSGRILAVEPTDNARRLLQQNLSRNSVSDKVVIFAGVATNHNGSDAINFIEGREEYSTMGVLSHPSVSGEQLQTKNVPAATLDALVAEYGLKPGFIKIDVEGAEHLVLGGAAETLKIHRPIILCEICDPLLQANDSSAEVVIQAIRSASYDVFDAEQPERAPGIDSYGNVICFPVESSMTVEAMKRDILRK